MAGGQDSLVQLMAATSLTDRPETCLCSDIRLSDDKEKMHIEFDLHIKGFEQSFVRIIQGPAQNCVALLEQLNPERIPPLNLPMDIGGVINITIPDPLKAILNKVTNNSDDAASNSDDAASNSDDAASNGDDAASNVNLPAGPHDVTIPIMQYARGPEQTTYRITNTEALMGLVITVQSYPKKWWRRFFWDAWLAVTIQLHLLVEQEPGDDQDLVFPTLWFKNIFDAERLCGKPKDVKCLVLGQDPVSRFESKQNMRKATGIAFHAIGNGNPSIKGMNTRYGLNCDNDNPKTHCRNGLLLVNMIRCIPEDSFSVDGNPYHNAWAAYTMKLAHYCATNQKKVVIMCRHPNKITQSYLPAAVGCAYEDAAAPRRPPHLANTPYCIVVSHPSSNATAAAAADDGKKFKDFVP